MKIIPLDPRHRKEAAKLLSEAFFNYPTFTFFFPNVKQRKRDLAWYLGNALNCTLSYGEAYTVPDLSGVMMLLLPGHTKITLLEYIQNGFFLTPFRLGFRNYVRSMRCETHAEEMHEKLMKGVPHYYLWVLAVAPQKARQGVGKTLIQHLLQKADAENMPIYLETNTEYNVGYYQHLGFSVMMKTEVPGYDIPFWCMVREPSSKQVSLR